ncbi:MAG: hypothetical protein JJU29_22485 [Verrucomicrobia bacterium]|nr:hypothetical protein [Verrucomicrobiota bacterium]MCH8514566.1 hypothetical protein [Kiritimatiellia bacterium]
MMYSQFLLRGIAWLSFLLGFAELSADTAGWPRQTKASEGVLWYWQNAKTEAMILDQDGETLRKVEGLLRGNAQPTWFWGVSPTGGYLEALDAGPALARSLARSLAETPSLHLEWALHPPREGAAQGLLAWIGDFGDEMTWQLHVRESRLVLQRVGEEEIDLGEALFPAPRHLAVSLTGEQIRVQWDGGDPVVHAGNRLPVIPDEWDVVFTFGGAPASDHSWTGALEGLYVSTRSDTAAAHARDWKEQRDTRKPPPVFDILAEVSTPAAEPENDAILEYDSILMATVWTLKEGVLPGVEIGGKFLTWHWYSLDRQVYKPPPASDEVRRLALSSADLHPQLEGVQKLSDPLEADDLLLLPELYLLRSVEP